MPLIFSGTSPEIKYSLKRSVRVPCESENQKTLESLIQTLDLNLKTQISPLSSKSCTTLSETTLYDVLTGHSVDDPDQGMDKDLPETPDHHYDPNGDRRWMGGTTGSTSQGFRHMYFGGWKLAHPLSTFQIPFRPVGQAPQRFQILAKKAKELIQSGQLLWGMRVLAWSMHYIQDLAQPFHAVQAVSLPMIPWYSLWTWPPRHALDQLVQESTRVVTNYHWAYEGYIRDLVKKENQSPFAECLNHPEKYSHLQWNAQNQDLISLAHLIAQASIELAPKVGGSELDFFGTFLRAPGVDFPSHLELINNAEYAIRPDLTESRDRLHRVTCQALANAALGSQLLLKWALYP
jgi:hypothetical protein